MESTEFGHDPDPVAAEILDGLDACLGNLESDIGDVDGAELVICLLRSAREATRNLVYLDRLGPENGGPESGGGDGLEPRPRDPLQEKTRRLLDEDAVAPPGAETDTARRAAALVRALLYLEREAQSAGLTFIGWTLGLASIAAQDLWFVSHGKPQAVN